MKITNIIFSGLLIILLTQSVLAQGTNKKSYFGARSTALNGLYFAGIDGINNIYSNPAGLSYNRGHAFEGSYYIRSEQNTFNGDLRSSYKSINKDFGCYNLGIYWSVLDDLTVGLGYEQNYNYEINWPYVLIIRKGTVANVEASDLYSREKNSTITPAVSYKIGSFSAGIAVNISNIKTEMSYPQKNYNWIDSISSPIYQFSFDKEGWLIDFNFGLMYDFNDNLRVGLTISNSSEKILDGTAKSELYAVMDSSASQVSYTAKYQSPWKLGLGFLYKINDDLKLNVDAQYNLYGNFDDQIERQFDNQVWQTKSQIPDSLTGFSISSIKQFFNNAFDFGVGLEFKAALDLDFNFGYRFSQSPNSDKSFDMLNPIVDQHAFSAGFAYYDQSLTIAGSLIFFTGIKKEVKGSSFNVRDGKYDTSGLIPTLSVKYEF